MSHDSERVTEAEFFAQPADDLAMSYIGGWRDHARNASKAQMIVGEDLTDVAAVWTSCIGTVGHTNTLRQVSRQP
jgi:hypothetical protein